MEAVFLCICRMGGLDTGIMNGSLVVKTYMCNAELNFNKLKHLKELLELKILTIFMF